MCRKPLWMASLTAFLNEKLRVIMLWLLEKFVVANVLQVSSSTSKLMKLDQTNSIICYLNLQLMIQHLEPMQRSNEATDEQMFWKNVKAMALLMVEKLMERSPLKCSLTVTLLASSPLQISDLLEETFSRRFSKLSKLLLQLQNGLLLLHLLSQSKNSARVLLKQK